MKITKTGVLIDIITFLSATVLIWGTESLRIVPLHLSLSTLKLILPVYPFQLPSGPGAGMFHLTALGIIYTAILSTVVVVAFRKTRKMLT